MSAYVLDTSALLALLYEEPGGKRVEMLLADEQCLIGAVAVTADRPWLDLANLVGVEIECIRPNRH